MKTFSDLSHSEINDLIAEKIMGWYYKDHSDYAGHSGWYPKRFSDQEDVLEEPNFFNDLNQCFEMEAAMDFTHRIKYIEEICMGTISGTNEKIATTWTGIHATAPMRCHAALLTYNLIKE